MCSCAYAFVMFFLQLALNVSTYRVHVVPQKTLDVKSKLGLCNNNEKKELIPILSSPCANKQNVFQNWVICVFGLYC